MRNWINLVESTTETYTLYHGTCSPESFLENGWSPETGQSGGNGGQAKYLYLTNGVENAEWFSNEKGCTSVLVVKNIPTNFLRVDPEDGSSDTVEEELNLPHGLPGNVVLFRALGPEHFELYKA